MKTRHLTFIALCTVVIVTITAPRSIAQTACIDSLQNVLASRTVRDTIRVNTLLELSSEHLNRGAAAASEYAKEALDISEAVASEQHVARSLIMLGNCASLQRLWDEAISGINKGRSIAEARKDTRTVARALAALTIAYNGKGVYDSAQLHGRHAIVLFEKLGDRTAQAGVLHNLGQMLFRQKKHDEALQSYKRGLELLGRDATSGARGRFHVSIARVHWLKREYTSSLEHYRRAVEEYEAANDTRPLALTLADYGWVMHLTGDNASALETMQRSLTLLRQLGEHGSEASVRQRRGNIFFRMGRYDEALQEYARCMTLHGEKSESKALAGLLNDIGNVYLHRNDAQQARACYLRALPIHRKLKDLVGMHISLLNLGIIHDMQGRGDSAMAYYKEALSAAQTEGHKAGIAKCLNNIGLLHYLHGQLDIAEQYFIKAVNIVTEEKFPDEARFRANLGIIQVRQGRLENGLRSLEESLVMAEQCDDARILQYVLQTYGTILHEHGYIDEARTYTDRALKLSIKMGDKRGIAEGYSMLAMFASGDSRKREAMDYIQQSQELYSEAGDVRGLSQVYRRKAVIHAKHGDADAAMAYHRLSLSTSEYSGDVQGTIVSLVDIAKLLLAKDETDSALAHCERACALARSSGFVALTKNALRMFSDIWAVKGEYGKAYEHFQQYVSLKDSLLNEANMRLVSELKEKYESGQKEQTIVLQKKEKEVRDLELQRSMAALRVLTLEALKQKQELYALEMDADLNRLQHEKVSTELAQRKKIDMQKEELLVLTQEKQAEKERLLVNEKWLRYALIGVILLIATLGLVLINRFREKQKLSDLRAREAEFFAQSASIQAMTVSLESERRERGMQQQFARRLLASQEEERARIARELHDSLSQGLIVVKNRAEMGLKHVNDRDKLLIHLRSIAEAAGSSLDDVRHIARDLRPHKIDELGITEALNSMVRLACESAELSNTVEIDAIDGVFPRDVEVAIFRLVQEAMNNIHKHANAYHVHVSVRKSAKSVLITVRDDGVGFDVREVSDTGIGLQGMFERVRILGGGISIDSSPGSGAEISAVIPVDALPPLRSRPEQLIQEESMSS